MNKRTKTRLEKIYQKLYDAFGPQHWWPGETPFEVIVGAILTQNTNWRNVEKALDNLKKARLLTPLGIKKTPLSKLSVLIKPSGFFNIKAKRLKNFINFIFDEYDGDLNKMAKDPIVPLREKILAVSGIGPETADSILLYAFGMPIFVVDAYTKRIFVRHGILDPDMDYHQIQEIFMNHLKQSRNLFNEYHALIVRVGKDYCRPRPLCEQCPLLVFFK